MMKSLELKTDIRVLFGEGTLGQIGVLAKELGFSRTLLVADSGLAKAGHLSHAHAVLDAAGIEALEFSNFGPNPDADVRSWAVPLRLTRALIRSSDSAAAVPLIVRRESTSC